MLNKSERIYGGTKMTDEPVKKKRGRPRLTDAEKATLKKWIEEGADFGSWTKGEYKED